MSKRIEKNCIIFFKNKKMSNIHHDPHNRLYMCLHYLLCEKNYIRCPYDWHRESNSCWCATPGQSRVIPFQLKPNINSHFGHLQMTCKNCKRWLFLRDFIFSISMLKLLFKQKSNSRVNCKFWLHTNDLQTIRTLFLVAK